MNINIRINRNGKDELIIGNTIEFNLEEYTISGGKRYVGIFNPKTKVSFKSAFIEFDQDFKDDDYILANGYQSWSKSKEYHINETEPKLNVLMPLVEKFVKLTGDNRFYKYTGKKGVIHSITYGYIRNKENYKLFGSLLDQKCFSIFESNVKNKKVKIIEDIKGLTTNSKRVIFDFVVLEGKQDEVFDKYFNEWGIKPISTNKVKGFTSWYNYYKNINEDIILKNLDNFIKFNDEGNKVDIFQIDDGYMYEVGDWLDVDTNKFPSGLEPIASKINEHFDSGLWLAPLTVSKKSKMAKEHKDYLLKDKKGRLVTSFSSCGPCYVLDVYNENVRKHLENVFKEIFDEWHFKMVKLDFLYASCVCPPINKTKAEVMYDTMVFLRKICGDHPILGCGVPLASSYGLVNYCRVGCDVSLDYGKVNTINYESVSTINDMIDSITRYPLSKRVFLNDPDVFLLRSDNIKMSDNEKKLLSIINAIFGDVLFTSDDFSIYPDKLTYENLKMIWHLNDCKIISYDIIDGNKVDVLISLDNKNYQYLINLSNKDWNYDNLLIEARNYLIINK